MGVKVLKKGYYKNHFGNELPYVITYYYEGKKRIVKRYKLIYVEEDLCGFQVITEHYTNYNPITKELLHHRFTDYEPPLSDINILKICFPNDNRIVARFCNLKN